MKIINDIKQTASQISAFLSREFTVRRFNVQKLEAILSVAPIVVGDEPVNITVKLQGNVDTTSFLGTPKVETATELFQKLLKRGTDYGFFEDAETGVLYNTSRVLEITPDLQDHFVEVKVVGRPDISAAPKHAYQKRPAQPGAQPNVHEFPGAAAATA